MPKTIPNIGTENSRAAVVAAIIGATKRSPFLGRTINSLHLEYDNDPSNIAKTNGRALVINPDRFASYEPGEQVGIIAHEALHVLLHHAQRFPSPQFDHARANVACDYAINGWLLGHGFDLPSDALYDAEFDGMGAGEIYARIPSPPQAPQWGGIAPTGEIEPDTDGQEVPAAVGAGLDELMQRELGMVPRSSRLSLDRVLARLLIVDPVWQRDYRRPSRTDEAFPGWIERDEQPRTVVCLDVSGSIRAEVRETFLGVLSRVTVPVTVIAVDTAIVKFRDENGNVCPGVWRGVDQQHCRELCEQLPRHGGGTLFQPAIDFAARERANLVYLTDGETPEPSLDRKGVPVVWLVWGKHPNRRAMEPCGKIIMVET